MSDIKITPSATGKRLHLHTPYSQNFVGDVKAIGGRWESAKKAWSVDVRDEQRARQLMVQHFGTDGTTAPDLVTVRVHLAECEDGYKSGGTASFAGRRIAQRAQRDAGVTLSSNVILIAGTLGSRGGSVRYPEIGAADDVIVEVRDVPKAALDADGIDYEIVGAGVVPERTAEDLRAERSRLLAQLAELDAELRRLDPEAAAAEQAQQDAETRRLTEERAERVAQEQRLAELRCRCGSHTCPPCGVSPAEYAEATGRAVATIHRWCRIGKVAAVQYRGRWIITAPTS